MIKEYADRLHSNINVLNTLNSIRFLITSYGIRAIDQLIEYDIMDILPQYLYYDDTIKGMALLILSFIFFNIFF